VHNGPVPPRPRPADGTPPAGSPAAGVEEALPARRRLGRRLEGSGIEVGPGRAPFRPPGVTVRTVGRWNPAGALAVRQALDLDDHPGAGGGDLEPDVVADVNVDRLGAFADASEDFVIASHVVEHLADPLGFLDDVHRVVRPGGTVLLFLPDRHRTADRFRPPTPLEHLVEDHRAATTEVSDAHLVEYARDRGIALHRGRRRREILDGLRAQSVHAHCWDAAEFVEMLRWAAEHLGHQWELLDRCLYEPPFAFEFGFLLRRGETDLDPATRAADLARRWGQWKEEERRRRPRMFDEPPSRLPGWAHRLGRRWRRRMPGLWRWRRR
jgi:SAM-dependent methyltransferase